MFTARLPSSPLPKPRWKSSFFLIDSAGLMKMLIISAWLRAGHAGRTPLSEESHPSHTPSFSRVSAHSAFRLLPLFPCCRTKSICLPACPLSSSTLIGQRVQHELPCHSICRLSTLPLPSVCHSPSPTYPSHWAVRPSVLPRTHQ